MSAAAATQIRGNRSDRWHHGPIVTPRADLSSLMQRVKNGDQDAFAILYDELAASVFGTIKRVLRDPAMSEEVTQEVFVELWRTAASFDPQRANVSTWAIIMARRRAIDRVRREESQRSRIERSASEPPAEVDSPADTVVASIEGERVRRAIAELSDDQRVVIEMAFIDGETHRDIAERLDLPLGTVKSRVRLGLKKLGTRLGAPT